MSRDRALAVAERIAQIADRRFVDPLLGLLLPGAGDLLGAGLGLYVIIIAWQARAPRTVIARMFLNLAVDALAGLIPIAGDLYDFLFRAHARNAALLRDRLHVGEIRARPT